LPKVVWIGELNLIVAINKVTGEVEAVGKEAKDMFGRTPEISWRFGRSKMVSLQDFKVTEKMLNFI
jgi:rod shape-determining protein MreB